MGAWVLVACRAFAAEPLRYAVDLRDPASHLVKVAMTIPEARPGMNIQIPTWTNLYQIRDFVRNVQDLRAQCAGQTRPLIRVDLNTWQTASGCPALELRYAVYANEDSIFSSFLDEEHAFLNFGMLLFYLPQDRERPARVTFLLPEGWKLATLIDDGDTPAEFKAANYDALVDSPAEAGNFQEYSYVQSGTTYRVVVRGDPTTYSSEKLLESLRKITATETALMQDVPFSRYTFIFHFSSGRGDGGMEHRYGTAISIRAADLKQDWGEVESTAAHEFFHLWNVKRIRPQGLEPVDYIHGNDTRDLWFSEGVTSTYQELALLRAGLIAPRIFYGRIASEIQQLEDRSGRLFQSLEDSGREAWLERYPDYFRPDRSVSYYNKGELIGFLLDLGIRHATEGQRSLDDVMRRLNEDFARRGRFFTQTDLRAIIAELAPRFAGLDTFFRDSVTGTRELDYNTYLEYVGLQLVAASRERPALGFLAVRSFDGPIRIENVEPGSRAEKAGLERGDILVKFNGRALSRLPEDEISWMTPGQQVKIEARRGRNSVKVKFRLGSKQENTYRIEEIEHPTPQQLHVRKGWLEGKN